MHKFSRTLVLLAGSLLILLAVGRGTVWAQSTPALERQPISFGTPASQPQYYSVLYSFQCGTNDAEYPGSGLVSDSAGNLYGTAGGGTNGWGTVFALSPEGTETVLHSFAGPPSDGLAPGYGALVRDSEGNLYGTTVNGGTNDAGTVFKVTSSGTETILSNLIDSTGFPSSGLVRDPAGNLYGTGYGGGYADFGSVFLVTPGAKLFRLYAFLPGSDGEHPVGGLVRDSDGNLYGTTIRGGGSGGSNQGGGTVFELSGDRTLKAYPLTKQDGIEPDAALIRDPAGNLYGTASEGTSSNAGSVFRVTPAGTLEVMHAFTGPPDGGRPIGGLVRDHSSNFYGTTYYGGTGTCSDGVGFGCGVIYEINSKGVESVLHSFTGTPDGSSPTGSALLLDSSGNLYGTTLYGGSYGCGTVFEYTP